MPQAKLAACLDHLVHDQRAVLAERNREWPASAAVLVGAKFMVFHGAKNTPVSIPTPALEAQVMFPVVVVLLMPAQIHKSVKGTGSAQHPSREPGFRQRLARVALCFIKIGVFGGGVELS